MLSAHGLGALKGKQRWLVSALACAQLTTSDWEENAFLRKLQQPETIHLTPALFVSAIRNKKYKLIERILKSPWFEQQVDQADKDLVILLDGLIDQKGLSMIMLTALKINPRFESNEWFNRCSISIHQDWGMPLTKKVIHDLTRYLRGRFILKSGTWDLQLLLERMA